MYDILLIVFWSLLVYMGYRFSQNRPELFTSKALTSAIGTLGVLAIVLMTFVFLGIMILRSL